MYFILIWLVRSVINYFLLCRFSFRAFVPTFFLSGFLFCSLLHVKLVAGSFIRVAMFGIWNSLVSNAMFTIVICVIALPW